MYKIIKGLDINEIQAKISALDGMNVIDMGAFAANGQMYAVAGTGATKTYKLLIGITPKELQDEIKETPNYYVAAVGTMGPAGKMYALLVSGVNAHYVVYVAISTEELEERINNAPEGYIVIDTAPIGTSGWMYALMSDNTASPGEPVLETKTVTANGTYTPSTGKDGFSSVTVNVTPNLQDKTVSIATLVSGGTITKDEGYDGLGTITLEA